MSVHDRAAVRATPRLSLIVHKYSGGCMQYSECCGLTASQLEEQKRVSVECWPYPSLVDPDGSYSLTFEVCRD